MTLRADAEAAFLNSGLDGVDRDLLFVLWHEGPGGVVEISLGGLAHLSGWDRSTVVRHRPHLAGWITWSSPSKADQRRHHARNVYTLHIPAGARCSVHPGLGAESDGLGAESDGLGAESDGLGAQRTTGLGAESDGLGAQRTTLLTDRGLSTSGKPWEDEDLLAAARDTLIEIGHPDASATAAAAVRQILEDVDLATISRPRRYVRASIRKEPYKFRPAPAHPSPAPGAAAGDRKPPSDEFRQIRAERGV
jgi:hypothetical protein